MREHIGCDHPAEGVFIFRGQPTIVFLTICTKRRDPRLPNSRVHDALIKAWETVEAWLVGFYVIMPDHVHLFCTPKNEDYSVEQWIAFWKRQFRRHGADLPRFQPRGFHHRLRRGENYSDKWAYVRQNPVRTGLVAHVDEWPYQGVLNELRW
jgi:REP element-mobilizing transposase RayT